ncbi:uncharacterized protein METZ01_LOCUS448136, partial [marine metagenome]
LPALPPRPRAAQGPISPTLARPRAWMRTPATMSRPPVPPTRRHVLSVPTSQTPASLGACPPTLATMSTPWPPPPRPRAISALSSPCRGRIGAIWRTPDTMSRPPAQPTRQLATRGHSNRTPARPRASTRPRATMSTPPRPHRPLPVCPGPTTPRPALRAQMPVCPQTPGTQCHRVARPTRLPARQDTTSRAQDRPRASTRTLVTMSTQEGRLRRPHATWDRTTLTRARLPAWTPHLGTMSTALELSSRRPAVPGPTI